MKLHNQFAVDMQDYLKFRQELKELEAAYKGKPKPQKFVMMQDILNGKLNRLSARIKSTGTSSSILYITGTFWESLKDENFRSRKRFEIYFINEFASVDLELLLQYYVKGLIDFKATLIPTGKPQIKVIENTK